MPSRRPHTKTRHGCAACKARKKRCDLEKPVCQNCARTGHECSWPNQAPIAGGQAWHTWDASSSSSASSSSRSPPWLLAEGTAQSHPVPSPELEALKLMHYFTALTCFSMTDNNTTLHRVWQVVVPRLAFEHSYLLHGLLSLAALHYHYDAPPDRRAALINMAREHQQAALSVYIGHLPDINEGNCHAMFAYSIILGGICYAFIQEPCEGAEQDDIVPLIIAAFDTLIGATIVAVQAGDWLRKGQLEPLMRPLVPYDECIARIAPSTRTVIEFLSESLPPVGIVMPGAEELMTVQLQWTYTTAIRALTLAFPYADGSLSSISDIVSWPVAAGTEYLALLKAQDSFALLILAYYGVALHSCDEIWFLHGLGVRLVQALAKKISEPWHTHIAWAKQQVSSDGKGDLKLPRRDITMME